MLPIKYRTMAIFRYVGSLTPTKSGNYRISMSRDSTDDVVFEPGEDFEVTDEAHIAKIEYMTSSWTNEFEFVRIG